MKVRHDEGVANRIDPEPYDANREGCVEASVGEHIGQPWSREKLKVSMSISVSMWDWRVLRVFFRFQLGLEPSLSPN